MMTTTKSAPRFQFDDLLDIAPANDVERRSPDDPAVRPVARVIHVYEKPTREAVAA